MHTAQPPVGGAAEAHPTRAAAQPAAFQSRTGGPSRSGSPSSTGAPSGIRKRRDFLAANSGTRVVTPAFILLVKPDASAETRAGFTVSKKVGNAVARNRAKRRLREVARLALAAAALPRADHVFIARAQPVETPFATLLADVGAALLKARRKLDSAR